MPRKRHRRQLLIAHLHPKCIAAAVQFRADPQARLRGGRPDQLDDHLMAGQRSAAPVHRDRAEQPMLDPVPLGGPWRQVTHGDRQPGLIGKPGQLRLPCPDPVAVGPAGVGTDQQPGGLGIGEPADLLPPTPQRLDRERRGVVVGPDADPAAVAPKVVDPIRDGLAQGGIGEVVDVDLFGLARRLPLPATVGEAPDQLLLLGVHAHHRLAGGQMLLGLLVEVAELGVTVGMLGALQGLGRPLQPVALLLEQPADGVVADRVALGGERLGQLSGGLAGPAQRAVGVAAGVGLHQPVQCRQQTRIGVAPPLGTLVLADAPPRVGRLVQLGCATADRRPGRLGQPRDPADPAIAQCPGRRAEQQPTLPLGQVRRDQGEGRRQHLIQIHWMNLTSPAQPGKVTERGPLTVLRVDFPETYRQIAEDPLLLPALDAYTEDPLSLDEVSREKVATFFYGSGLSGEAKGRDSDLGAIPSEDEAALIVPPHCLPVIEFLKATSEAAGRVGSLDPFFYLGQAPNEVILGSTVFGGIRDGLKNNDARALGDLLRSLRTEPKSMQAAVDTIIDELKEITDIRTLSAYVKTCIDMLAQASLERTEECQRLAGELVLLLTERPWMHVDSDRLARLIALSPPSNMQDNLMHRLDHFDGDSKAATRQALGIYQLALERKPSGYDHRSALIRYFRGVVGVTDPTSLRPQLDIESADANLGFGQIADNWLRMAFEKGQPQCDYILGEDFYLYLLAMIMKEKNTAQRLRLTLGLSKLVQSSALAKRSRALREMVWLCLRADDQSLQWCAVRILTHLKLVDDDFGRLLEVLPIVMDLETVTYPETVVDLVDLMSEWSSTFAHAGGRSESDTLVRQRVTEILGVALQRRDALMRSLVKGEEADDVVFKPDLLIAALLRLRVQVDREDDLFAHVVNEALRSEQEATLELPSEEALRAITLCSHVIESHPELPEPLKLPVLDTLALLLRSDDPIEARRLVQAWRNLLTGDEQRLPRQQIIAAMQRVAMTVPEAVYDVREDIAGLLEGRMSDDSEAPPEPRRVY
jgi:hypothetical protein